MKIARAEVLQADGGLKTLSFLKLSTDDGLVGWSEFSEFIGTQALGGVVRHLVETMLGQDPRALNAIAARLHAQARTAPGGLNAQAAAAIENACLDLKAKALGVPVYDLFGGAVRESLPVYASHVGTYRIRDAALFGAAAIRRVDDFEPLGAEIAARGLHALKTNIVLFDGPRPVTHMPGFGAGAGHPERALTPRLIDTALAQLQALRRGAGPGMELMLDINFNFAPEGCRRLAHALAPLGLRWLEVDLPDPQDLAELRRATPTPIASLEAVYHRHGVRPYLEARSVDVAIVDPMWNGWLESQRIAQLAQAWDVPVSSHAYTSHLALTMGMHLGAVTPNFGMVEMDLDQPPWHDDLFTAHPVLHEGRLQLPQGPGWGLDVVEEAVRAHPPRLRPR